MIYGGKMKKEIKQRKDAPTQISVDPRLVSELELSLKGNGIKGDSLEQGIHVVDHPGVYFPIRTALQTFIGQEKEDYGSGLTVALIQQLFSGINSGLTDLLHVGYGRTAEDARTLVLDSSLIGTFPARLYFMDSLINFANGCVSAKATLVNDEVISFANAMAAEQKRPVKGVLEELGYNPSSVWGYEPKDMQVWQKIKEAFTGIYEKQNLVVLEEHRLTETIHDLENSFASDPRTETKERLRFARLSYERFLAYNKEFREDELPKALAAVYKSSCAFALATTKANDTASELLKF